MSKLKKVWISKSAPYSISMEYVNHRDIPYSLNTQRFPADPTPEHPLRQTSVLGVLDQESLRMLRDAIDEVLED